MSMATDVKLLCETVLHFNEEGLQKLGYTRDDLYQMWTGSLVESFKTGGQNILSDEQVARIGKAVIDALQKVEVATTELAEGKVKVTVKGIDLASVFGDKNLQLDVPSTASRQEITDSITRILENRFKDLKPVQTMMFVAKCKYVEDEGMWLPTDMKNFVETLSASAGTWQSGFSNKFYD